jgi:hypothetical protein
MPAAAGISAYGDAFGIPGVRVPHTSATSPFIPNLCARWSAGNLTPTCRPQHPGMSGSIFFPAQARAFSAAARAARSECDGRSGRRGFGPAAASAHEAQLRRAGIEGVRLLRLLTLCRALVAKKRKLPVHAAVAGEISAIQQGWTGLVFRSGSGFTSTMIEAFGSSASTTPPRSRICWIPDSRTIVAEIRACRRPQRAEDEDHVTTTLDALGEGQRPPQRQFACALPLSRGWRPGRTRFGNGVMLMVSSRCSGRWCSISMLGASAQIC